MLYIPAPILAFTASHCQFHWNLNEILLEKKKDVVSLFSFNPDIGIASICSYTLASHDIFDIEPTLFLLTDTQRSKLEKLRGKHNVFFDKDRFRIEVGSSTEEMEVSIRPQKTANDRRELYRDMFEFYQPVQLTDNPTFSIKTLQAINLDKYDIYKKYDIEQCTFYKIPSSRNPLNYPLCIEYNPINVYGCDDPYISQLSIKVYLLQHEWDRG